jgi:hypothetical protein
LLVNLSLEAFQIFIVFEDGKDALAANHSHHTLFSLLHNFLILLLWTSAVILFNGEGKFSWTYGGSSIHKGIEGFGLYDELVIAVEN